MRPDRRRGGCGAGPSRARRRQCRRHTGARPARPRFVSYPDHLRGLVEEHLAGLRFVREPAASGLEEAMRYSLLAGGKRIRPVLALATAAAIGRDPRDVLPLAAAL